MGEMACTDKFSRIRVATVLPVQEKRRKRRDFKCGFCQNTSKCGSDSVLCGLMLVYTVYKGKSDLHLQNMII